MGIPAYGAAYEAAFAAMARAGAVPSGKALTETYPLITIAPDGVSIDDDAVLCTIDALLALGHCLECALLARVVLRAARTQREAWLELLAQFWTQDLVPRDAASSTGGQHGDDQGEDHHVGG